MPDSFTASSALPLQYMNRIEHGKQNPTLKVIQVIADVHDIKLSKLFALAEKKHARNRR